jgi:hypothetical protein
LESKREDVMAEYKLTAFDTVIRTADGANIPPDPANADYAKYLQWVHDGGIADPYVAPPPPIESVPHVTLMLWHHENRLRHIESKHRISLKDFLIELANV